MLKPANPGNVKPLDAVPRAPASLPKCAKVFFRKIAALLVADGRLYELHLQPLENLARDFALIQDLEAAIAAHGVTMIEVKDNGAESIKARPELHSLAVVRRRFDQLSYSFGLTPTTSKRLPEPVMIRQKRLEAAQAQYEKLLEDLNRE